MSIDHRRHLFRASPILLALALMPGGRARATQEPGTGTDDPPARALQAVGPHVRSAMERDRIPGVAVALTTRDGLAGVRTWGYADQKRRRPVTEETLFQIGSITKSFTALALLGLSDGGRLDLDAPVRRYLPWFEVRSEFEPIRVIHLLTHTAGIPANRDDIVSSPYMARALSEQAAAWAPGTRFHYSNIGYQTLHVLLERVAGESYQELVERRILGPLGMADSRAAITLESRTAQAIGYVPPFDDRPRHHSRELVEAPHHEYRIGDGCIQTTAGDLAAYVRMWLNRGQGPNGRIVSAAAFRRFTTPHPGTLSKDGSRGYGLGVNVQKADGREYLRHSGGMVGFTASALASMTDGLGVVVLMNGPGDPGSVAGNVLDAWRAAVGDKSPPEPPAGDEPGRIGSAPDYAGRFVAESGAALGFEVAGDGLLLTHDGETIALDRAGRDAFYTPHPEFDRYVFAFGRNADGDVVEVAHGPAWYVNERYDGPRRFATPQAWSAYVGRYRNFSPWFPYFEVIASKGRLSVITGEGGESASGVTLLVPRGDGVFQVGEEATPETLRFEEVVDGRALRAVWSGHPFFRQ